MGRPCRPRMMHKRCICVCVCVLCVLVVRACAALAACACGDGWATRDASAWAGKRTGWHGCACAAFGNARACMRWPGGNDDAAAAAVGAPPASPTSKPHHHHALLPAPKRPSRRAVAPPFVSFCSPSLPHLSSARTPVSPLFPAHLPFIIILLCTYFEHCPVSFLVLFFVSRLCP